MNQEMIYLIALWLAYFLIHSVLAGLKTKQRIQAAVPSLLSYYRIVYNLLAVLLLIPPLYYVYYVPSSILWNWTGWEKYAANGLAILTFIGFLWTLKYYDGMDFLGFKGLKKDQTNISEKFSLSPLHAYVRHPWYSLALIMIWTRDMNQHMFISAVLITAYLFVGSFFEDQKLIKLYGEKYRRYRQAVPGIIPSFRRNLNKAQLKTFSENKPD